MKHEFFYFLWFFIFYDFFLFYFIFFYRVKKKETILLIYADWLVKDTWQDKIRLWHPFLNYNYGEGN